MNANFPESGFSRASYRCLRAFTLVEILVSVVIIGVLAAFFLPAYAKVKENSEKLQCLTHLKSIGVAMGCYVADNNGYYALDETGDNNGVSYQELLSPYLGINDWKQVHNGTPTIKSLKTWACPAEKDLSKYYYCYALNMDLNLRMNSLKGESPDEAAARYRIKAANVAEPGSFALVCDSFHKNIIYTTMRDNLINSTMITRRHAGQPNILYADGHAASYAGEIYGYKDNVRSDFYLKMWRWNGQKQ